MAIKALRGKSYSFRDGLSNTTSNWFVVGKIFAPIRIDKVLGWREPILNKPTFTQSIVYLVLPAEYIDNAWINISNDAYLVPIFAVDQILETSVEGRVPLTVESPVFKDMYMIDLEYSSYQVMDINTGPIRMDKILDWRDPEVDEQPVYVLGDIGSCVPATFNESEWVIDIEEMIVTNTPLFLVTKVYEWKSDCQCDISVITGPQGPQGIEGPIGSTGSTGATAAGPIIVSGISDKERLTNTDSKQIIDTDSKETLR